MDKTDKGWEKGSINPFESWGTEEQRHKSLDPKSIEIEGKTWTKFNGLWIRPYEYIHTAIKHLLLAGVS